MSTLTVWKFDSPSGAEEAATTLARLDSEHLIVVHDAFAGNQPSELLFTNLDQEQEDALREVFAD